MNSVPWGGSEVLWYEAAELVALQGHSVSLCTPRWPELASPLVTAKEKWGADHCFDSQPPNYSLISRITRRVRRRQEESLMRQWLRRTRPSLLCISNGNAYQGLEWMEAAIAENIPFVTIAQAHADFLGPSDNEASRLIHAFSLSQANYFVARANQELVESQLGISLGNSRIIGNHSRHLSIASPVAWPEHPHRSIRLACVARLHPASKGQDLLFRVLAGDRWRNRDWHLSLYGKGEQEQCLRRLATMLGIEQRVTFMGHSGSPMTIWDTHHALVLASRYEGTPLVLMEAMLAGRPVISTAVAGIPELIQHGHTGYLAQAPTVEHLQICLEESWANRDQWQSVGLAAHRFAVVRAREVPAQRLAKELLGLIN